ncbi:MAG: hypothetical protein ABIX01_00280 [Chitinophagaceae bacterium]
MKIGLFNLLLIGAVILSSASAQTVNDVPLKDIDVEYVEIVGTPKLFNKKVTIEIDFGQENKFWSQNDTQLKDSTGKLLVLNSMIDALNFMSKSGYEFVFAYTVPLDSKYTSHYLLKKRKQQ